MFRILLLLCSFVLAYSAHNNTTSVINSSPSPSPIVSVTASFNMSASMLPTAAPSSSSVVYTSSVHPNATVAPTHMPHSVNATSAVLTTSSVKPPTPVPTKPTPKPTPKPDHGVYNVPGKANGSYCLLAELDVMFHVNYLSSVVVNKTTNTTMNKNETAKVPIPYPHNKENITIKVSGQCGEKKSLLKIEWQMSTFEMEFVAFNPDKNNNNKTNLTDWKVENVAVSINTSHNEQFKSPVESIITASTSKIGLKGSIGSGYLCNSDSSYSLSEDVTVVLAHVKVQPFEVVNSTYSNVDECPQDTTPTPKKEDNNIVPIAVGCALAGLVLIVLIAYIIGRRKSQRGYEKV